MVEINIFGATLKVSLFRHFMLKTKNNNLYGFIIIPEVNKYFIALGNIAFDKDDDKKWCIRIKSK